MKCTSLAGRALLVGAAMLVALPAALAEPSTLPERWLAWQNNDAAHHQSLSDCDASQSLAAEWDLGLQRLASAIARSGGATPQGLYGRVQGGIGNSLQDGQPCKGRPLMGFLDLGFWREQDVTAAPGQRPRLKRDHSHYFPLLVRLNTFTGLGSDRMPGFLRGKDRWTGIGVMQQTASLQGFPILGQGALVITPPGHAPAFVPLALDSALKLWLPALSQALQEQEAVLQQYPAPQRDDFRKRILEPIQALLARGQALQRQDRGALKGPAFLKVDMASGEHEIVAQPGPDAHALMMPNPDYFDPRLPRSALQLMVVEVGGLGLDQPAVNVVERSDDAATLMRQFLEKVDWKAIAKAELRQP